MIALIDYGAGNLTSVKKALEHLDATFRTPTEPAELNEYSALIVPGVGNFEATETLVGDWNNSLAQAIEGGTPLLGICLGLQWLFEGSEEAPQLKGLGTMLGTCSLIQNSKHKECSTLKVPHVGWNSLHLTRRSWLLDGINENDQVYFTHSYAAPITDDCVASTTHGVEFASVVERDHIVGMQFHPEKSGTVGLQILSNFLKRASTGT
jgi:glutamine amidotransferase